MLTNFLINLKTYKLIIHYRPFQSIIDCRIYIMWLVHVYPNLLIFTNSYVSTIQLYFIFLFPSAFLLSFSSSLKILSSSLYLSVISVHIITFLNFSVYMFPVCLLFFIIFYHLYFKTSNVKFFYYYRNVIKSRRQRINWSNS